MASHHASLTGNAELSHAAAAVAAAAAANAQEAKDQDLQHAVDFYQKGMEIAHNASTYDDYCRAIEHFSLTIAIRNTQPRFFLARGNAFRSINEYEHAAKDYGMAITLDDRSPLYYANRGGCYRKLNQPIAALEDLTAAIEMDVKKGNHYFNRALVLYDAGFYREAIIDFTRTLEEGTVGGIGSRIEYRALQNRGNCYRRLGNLTKCIDDLENAIKIDPRNSTGFSYLAQAYYECGDYNRATEQYTHAIEFNNVNASYYSYRGLCYYRKGEDFARNCLADFNHSIKLDGKDPQAYFYRGSMRLWLALELLAANAASQAQQQAHASGSSSTSASASSTTTAASNGTSTTSTAAQSSAKPSVAPTLSLPAQDIAAEANGGLSMPSLGFLTAGEQLEAAFSDIEMAWTFCPTGTQYQIGMAMITQLKKQHREASALFDEISGLDRTQVVVKYHLALSQYMLDEHEKVLALLTDAIEALPDEPLFYEARGLLLQELQLHPLAIDDFTRAIELNPDNPVNLYLRSESFLRLEKFTDTVADCTSALNRGYTSDLSVYNARGMAYRGLNEYDKALADISVCLSKAPGNDIFHSHRGVCYMECGRYADALPDLHAALNQNQRDAKMLYFIGLCYYHEKEPKECRRYLQLALRNKPSKEILPDLYYHIGISHALENCNIDAIENFTFALEHSSTFSAPEGGHAAEIASSTLLSTQLLHILERAKALQLEKYFEEAIDDFDFVIQHNPNNAHAYFRRGFAHKSLGNLQDAASDFEATKLLDPANLQLVVNYKEIKGTECIVLCAPGEERVF
ncbi:Mitochondrial import inner membrane translocase subunit tim16, partial [Globisporangium splendens]